MRGLLLAVMFCCLVTPAAAEGPGELVRVPVEGFPDVLLDVPGGWEFATDRKGVSRGQYAYFRAAWPDGQPTELPRTNVRASEWGESLPQGAAYVELSVRMGGGYRDPLYCHRFREEHGEVRLQELRREAPIVEEWSTLTYTVGFTRWQRSWQALAVFRPPVDESMIQEALGILRSVRFPKAPVMARAQAIEEALLRLPREFYERDPCVFEPPMWVETELTEDGWELAFVRHQEGGPVGERRVFQVATDGTCVELGTAGRGRP